MRSESTKPVTARFVDRLPPQRSTAEWIVGVVESLRQAASGQLTLSWSTGRHFTLSTGGRRR